MEHERRTHQTGAFGTSGLFAMTKGAVGSIELLAAFCRRRVRRRPQAKEVSDRATSASPLGLASWRSPLPGAKIPLGDSENPHQGRKDTEFSRVTHDSLWMIV